MKNNKSLHVFKYLAFALLFVVILFSFIVIHFIGVYKIVYPNNVKNNINENYSMHLSFDDVDLSLKNLATEKYDSLFEEPFFAWLKKLNKNYNATFSLYVYNNSLSLLTNKYESDFYSNSGWLKIGLHCDNESENYANLTFEDGKEKWNLFVDNMLRVTGSTNSIDFVPRLHNYACSQEAISGMLSCLHPPKGFLTADDNRVSYSLTNNQIEEINTKDYIIKDSLHYFKTDFRLDWFSNNFSSKNLYKKPTHLTVYNELLFRFAKEDNINNFVVFTHEWQIYNGKTINKNKTWVEDCCKFASEYNIKFDYIQNLV